VADIFSDMDLSDFREVSDYACQEYVDDPLTDELLRSVETELAYRLPRANVELMQGKHGGMPRRTCFPTVEPTSWAQDHVMITGIYAIGRTKSNSLCGELGKGFWTGDWGYPTIGVYFADCPSSGHNMICLNYRDCGPFGEPRVVYVDQELYYKITNLARNFEQFIRGLKDEEEFM
jgi:hypothetical protein